MSQPHAVCYGPKQDEAQHASRPEERRLIEERLLRERLRRRASARHAIRISGAHLEGVRSGIQVGVRGRSARFPRTPRVIIPAEAVLVLHLIRRNECGRGKVDGQLLGARHEFDGTSPPDRGAVDRDGFDCDGRGYDVAPHPIWVNAGRPLRSRKPQRAVGAAPSGRLRAAIHLVGAEAIVLAKYDRSELLGAPGSVVAQRLTG